MLLYLPPGVLLSKKLFKCWGLHVGHKFTWPFSSNLWFTYHSMPYAVECAVDIHLQIEPSIHGNFSQQVCVCPGVLFSFLVIAHISLSSPRASSPGLCYCMLKHFRPHNLSFGERIQFGSW